MGYAKTRGRPGSIRRAVLSVMLSTAFLAGSIATDGTASAADRAEAEPTGHAIAAGTAPTRLNVLRPVRPVGSGTRLIGRVPTRSHDRVAIGFLPLGSDRWQGLGRIGAGPAGFFSAAIPTARTGAIVAVPRIGLPSRPASLRVLSRTRFAVTKRHVNVGEPVGLIGRSFPGGRRGFRVVVKGPDGRVIDRAMSAAGKVRAGWRPAAAGRYVLEAFAGKNRRAHGSRGPRRVVDVYRPAGASWYGPGFFGGRSACGATLTPSTSGVAHKTLPCGTEVRLRNGNRVVKTRVIDRGPFIPGREFDLTQATRNALGFGDVGTVYVSY